LALYYGEVYARLEKALKFFYYQRRIIDGVGAIPSTFPTSLRSHPQTLAKIRASRPSLRHTAPPPFPWGLYGRRGAEDSVI